MSSIGIDVIGFGKEFYRCKIFWRDEERGCLGFGKMKSRNLKVRKFLKALKDYGCVEVRNTSHGVIVENPKNKRSTNVPVHQEILPVWIYKNILRQLDINREEIEKHF